MRTWERMSVPPLKPFFPPFLFGFGLNEADAQRSRSCPQGKPSHVTSLRNLLTNWSLLLMCMRSVSRENVQELGYMLPPTERVRSCSLKLNLHDDRQWDRLTELGTESKKSNWFAKDEANFMHADENFAFIRNSSCMKTRYLWLKYYVEQFYFL